MSHSHTYEELVLKFIQPDGNYPEDYEWNENIRGYIGKSLAIVGYQCRYQDKDGTQCSSIDPRYYGDRVEMEEKFRRME